VIGRAAVRRWATLGLAALAACVAAAVALASRSSPGVSATVCRTALIPAYVPPDQLGRITARVVPGRLVVINPGNGPGAAASPAYRSAVAAAQGSGTRVLGYVHTGYGARPAADVIADAARYLSWYGVDGVFFDEAADDDARLAYYQSIAGQAHAAGLRLVALNPGTVPARGYFDAADIVVTFEGAAAAYAGAMQATPAWMGDIAPAKVAHLIYGATREQALAAVDQDGAGYLYATTDALPDPWSTLPPYLDELETRLGTCP
jgi:Spherulation-specific family 4